MLYWSYSAIVIFDRSGAGALGLEEDGAGVDPLVPAAAAFAFFFASIFLAFSASCSAKVYWPPAGFGVGASALSKPVFSTANAIFYPPFEAAKNW
jgi:hypothetical protein